MAKEKTEVQEKYSKERLLNSLKFIENKDLLNALLDNEKEYTIEEVEGKIKGYLKGEVK